MKLDEASVNKFTDLLGSLETTGKADHAAVQQFGQQAVDFYLSEVQRIGQEVAQHQINVWNRLNEQRVAEFKSDPEIGGAREQTSLGNAKYVLESWFGLQPDKVSNLLQVLDAGGVSNHVDFIRGLNNIYERFREPEPLPAPVEPRQPRSREPGQRGWYDDLTGGKAA